MTSEAIIGLRFFSGPAAAAVDEALTKKGLIVIPAAPALVKLNYDEEYRHALQTAELVIPDSALLARLAHIVCDAPLHNISAAAFSRTRDATFVLSKRHLRVGFCIGRNQAARVKLATS